MQRPPEPQQESAKEHSSTETATPEGSPPLSVNSPKPRQERQPAAGSATSTEAPVDIVLGSAAGGNDEVSWRVSIRANPHLMIVGLPGMGKTTCLINICRQLNDAGISPIIFSYHDDIDDMRLMCVTSHVAQNNKGRASAIDARTTRHQGYALSQKKRKLIEEALGWRKTIGGLARPMRKGKARMGFVFTFTMAAYDLVRLPRLPAEANA